MKRRLMVAVGAFALGLLSGLPAGTAETLDDILAEAYTTNPTLLAQRARLRAVDESVPQALSNWRPTVATTGQVGRIWDNSSTRMDDRYTGRTPKSVGASVTQPLYRGGRTVAQTRQAEATVEAGRALLLSTEQSVLLSAASAYLAVVRDQAVLELSMSNERVLERQLRDTQAQFAVGQATRTDVSQAEARLAQARAGRIAAEGTLQGSRATFVNVVGRAALSPLETPPSAVSLPTELDEVQALSENQNPSVQAAAWTAQAAKEGIDLIQGELLPSLSLSGGMARNLDANTRGVTQNASQVMVQLNVPIYEGGAVYSRLRAQKQTYGQNLIQSDQERRNARQNATTDWENLLSARAQARSFEAQITAADLALKGVQEEARVGTRTVLDVLNAEQELFNAKVNRVKATHDELLAAYMLRVDLGQMTAQALGLKVEIYDPLKNYDNVRGQWMGWGIDQDYEDGRPDPAPQKSGY